MVNRRLLRIKVLQLLFGFFSGGAGSLPATEKSLRHSIDRYYDLLHLFLLLPEALVGVAQARIEHGRQKFRPTPSESTPNMRFVENRVLAALAANEPSRSFASSRSLGWSVYRDLLRLLFDELASSDFYIAYMDDAAEGWGVDRAFAAELFSWFSDSKLLRDHFEEVSTFWVTDVDTVCETLYERVGGMRERDSVERLIVESEAPPEQVNFAVRLLEQTVLKHHDLQAHIVPHLHNWDAERIASMDMLILEMAVSESVSFPDIPRRVTLNEYIELARLFSTPTSPAFINGVMDNVIQSLLQDGMIKKVGRGLQGEIL